MSPLEFKTYKPEGGVGSGSPSSLAREMLQQQTQTFESNGSQEVRRAQQKSIDATNAVLPFQLNSQPLTHHPYSLQESARTIGSGSGSHKPRQESLGGSFLVMGTDSSPNTSFSTSVQAPRHQSNGSGSGAIRAAGVSHAHSSSSSGRWNTAHNIADHAYPSSSSPPRIHESDARKGVTEDFSDESVSSAFGSPSARPRASTRGAKLGMQLAKQRSAASQQHLSDQPLSVIDNIPAASGASLRHARGAKDIEMEKTSILKPTTDSALPAGSSLTHVVQSSSPIDILTLERDTKESQLDSPLEPILDNPAGPLSDITIATLGAIPGVDPVSLLNTDNQPLSSKNILTIALQKAQSAVLLDSSNNVPEAILAYRQAVRLLQEVMDRVSPKSGAVRSSSRRQNREEERRRLKVIYETYAERIRLLTMIQSPGEAEDLADASTAAVGDVSLSSLDGTGDQTADTSQSVLAESEIADRLAQVDEGDYVHERDPLRDNEGRSLAPTIKVETDDSIRLSPSAILAREELRTPATPYFEIDPMLGLKSDQTDGGEVSDPRSDRLGGGTSAVGLDQEQQNTAGLAPQRAAAQPGGRLLVSPTVTAGSILQRRKSSVSTVLTSDGPERDDLSTPTLASMQFAPSEGPSYGHDEHSVSFGASSPQADGSSSSGRKRAISTPGQRRPGIPASFLTNRHNEGVTPPLPANPHADALISSSSTFQAPMKVRRKASMPLNLISTINRNQLSVATNADRNEVPSPVPSSYSGYHVLGTPMSGVPMSLAPAEERKTLLEDLFPNPLPSMQLGAPPAYAFNSAALGLPWLGVTNALPDTSTLPWPPSDRAMRPFHTVRQLQLSMERGAFVTRRLFVDRDVWLQPGTRLHALDTKARSAEMLMMPLESVSTAGAFLLNTEDGSWPASGTLAIHAAGFLRRLDELETVMNDVRVMLAKKLGHVDSIATSTSASPGAGGGQQSTSSSSQSNSPAGAASSAGSGKGEGYGGGTVKRSNMNTLNSLSSKLQRSLNHMVAHNSKGHGADSPSSYVDSLSKVFRRAQVIADHLRALPAATAAVSKAGTTTSVGKGYAALTEDVRTQIEQRLRRASDFLANVVLRFVLRDLAILLDKSLKRTAGLLIE